MRIALGITIFSTFKNFILRSTYHQKLNNDKRQNKIWKLRFLKSSKILSLYCACLCRSFLAKFMLKKNSLRSGRYYWKDENYNSTGTVLSHKILGGLLWPECISLEYPREPTYILETLWQV